MDINTTEEKKSVSQTIDFYKIFKVFLSRWYWILGCIIVALIIAKVKILFTDPIYTTSASLKMQDSGNALNGAQAAMPSYNYTDRIQAESYVIKSNDVVSNAIGKLQYKISFFEMGKIRDIELYPKVPFQVQIIQQDSLEFGHSPYLVEAVDAKHFKIKDTSDPSAKFVEVAYRQPIKMGNMAFSINSTIPSDKEYSFKFNSKEEFIGRIIGGLNISEAARFTNVMSITMTDGNPVFAADALNAVMEEYINYDLTDKRKSAKQTVAFIENQLDFINGEANKSGSNLADYKTQNKIVDLNSVSSLSVGKLSELEKQKSVLAIEMLSINQLEQKLNSNKEKLEVNLNIEGSTNGLLDGLIAQLNPLIMARQAKLNQFNPNSQPIQELDNQIAMLKQSLRNNIYSLKERNQRTVSFINQEIAQANQAISTMPKTEQNMVKLTSNFEVNNKVRSFLAEKKLEAEMNGAAVVAGVSIVNIAYPSYYSIVAGEEKIYSYGVILGLAAGIGLILLVRFVNPYIYDKETVESLTNTPIIGVIRKFPQFIDENNRQALSLAQPRSVFAESVRSVRTNLSYMASNKKSKTICITSEISGEGKSFVTVNLAGTLALIDKKIILIAADLRKSKLHHVFGSDNKIGLSSYLQGTKTFDEVMIHDDVHNIDFIPSGPVPSNPSELLHSDQMKNLLNELSEKYDYVLVDTAPVGLVSDSIPLIRQSDINIFVIRSGKSQFRAAAIPERLSREYNLSNLGIILNAFGDDALHANYYTTDYNKGGGNSTYYYSDYSGYVSAGYYDEDKSPWWKFWKK